MQNNITEKVLYGQVTVKNTLASGQISYKILYYTETVESLVNCENMQPIILNNSVLVDIILVSEDRSEIANRVYQCMKRHNFEIFLPYFALFEIKSAISNKKINTGSVDFRRSITKDDPLACKYFSIDEAFVTRHLDSSIGYLKAADYVYVCLAKQENGILITEDNKQYKVSKDAGIETYKLEEFANHYS